MACFKLGNTLPTAECSILVNGSEGPAKDEILYARLMQSAKGRDTSKPQTRVNEFLMNVNFYLFAQPNSTVSKDKVSPWSPLVLHQMNIVIRPRQHLAQLI